MPGKKIIIAFLFIGLVIRCHSPASEYSTNGQSERGTSNLQSARPNIIVILADDMGFSDLGSYGGEIATPELDSLANNGLRFSQFYNTARCCPTRASLLTGLYPSQTGMGFMTEDENLPGYRGEIGSQCVTMAEMLQPAGYRTYMSGKWHVARNLKDIDSLKYNWPLQRGFDKFYGTIIGAGSLWDPWTLTRNNTFITPFNDPEYSPEQKWYYTDAISDNATKYIEEHTWESEEDPFFMYVAYTSPHWPLHAPEDEIALQKGNYDQGMATIREKRYERLKSMGMIDENWPLSEPVAAWDTLQNQDWHARNMEVYAAMITRMDKGIGKIVDKLKEKGMLDNTLILFLQDNGGCAETLNWVQATNENNELSDLRAYPPMGSDELQTQMFPKQNREGFPVVVMGKNVMAGSDQTYHAYGPVWANVSNTPFREFKHWVNEGGVATPLIAHWPAVIRDRGQIRHQPGHLIDIMATVVDITGATYPSEFKGNAIVPMEGKSLKGVFANNEAIEREAIYFEHEGNRGLRKGKWKLVSKAYDNSGHFRKVNTLASDQWELYDMEKDRTETMDLAQKHPDRVRELSDLWQQWAKRTNAIPKQ
ncbi:arylsulfatase [Cyclobacterium jeungdonense]|uniref:Arylsulfatase n=1 Tax=Cyclobacterium jeungdonense TaxID=708087 RepID=A0ABT8CFH6_9BACT|nr:arylsulfatase [Cyclobacterium jeungdonense]MDN3690465.1 arylsulfatase [Cyclobacterium jeungdonense]